MSEDVRRSLQDPGYTPPRRAFEEIVAILADPELGARAERALASAGLPAASYVAETLDQVAPAATAPAVRLIGRAARLYDAPDLLAALGRMLASPSGEARRQAAMALGKSGRSEAEALLLPQLETNDPKLLRTVVEALGKVGGSAALSRLRELHPPETLKQVVERATLILERSALRAAGIAEPIDIHRPLPEVSTISLGCRAGLSELLADEATAFSPRVVSSSEVVLEHAGPLEPLLQLRLASSLAIVWLLEQGSSPSGVLSALLSPKLVPTLQAWTNGALRFRLEWHGSGHRRADTWRIAQGLHEASSPLLNDPVQAPWTIEVQREPARLLLKPIAAPELRFGYRVRDVPAASHPTLAAALARVAGQRADDVVWDPFVGSGAELIERARLGAFGRLHGSDLDARALGAARENLVSAALMDRTTLEQADARTHRVPGLSLVLTNPPMGRRVLRARGLSGVLCQVVRNVASQLVAGGRMVWLSPFPDATARAANDAGLQVERFAPVDLGGFTAELQRFTRSA